MGKTWFEKPVPVGGITQLYGKTTFSRTTTEGSLGAIFLLMYHLSQMGNVGHLTCIWLQLLQIQHCPFLSACAVFLHVQTVVRLPVFGTFNECTDVDACDSTWGLCKYCKGVFTESWLGQESLPSLWSQYCTWFFSPTLPTEQQSLFNWMKVAYWCAPGTV